MIRPGNADDVSYIFRRTLKDLRKSDFHTSVQNSLFYIYAHRAWEHTLTRSLVRVAFPGPEEKDGQVLAGNTRNILGFIVADVTDIGLVVHYINTRRDYDTSGHVMADYRRQGIAQKLLQSMLDDFDLKRVIYTHRTAMFRKVPAFRQRIDGDKTLQYNPWLFFTLLPRGWEMGVMATLDPNVQTELHHIGQKWPVHG